MRKPFTLTSGKHYKPVFRGGVPKTASNGALMILACAEASAGRASVSPASLLVGLPKILLYSAKGGQELMKVCGLLAIEECHPLKKV